VGVAGVAETEGGIGVVAGEGVEEDDTAAVGSAVDLDDALAALLRLDRAEFLATRNLSELGRRGRRRGFRRWSR
jgi:hypothetical protein